MTTYSYTQPSVIIVGGGLSGLSAVYLARASHAVMLFEKSSTPGGRARTREQVCYLDGGWQTLVDGLRQKAQEACSRLITQARVKAIEVAGEGYSVRLADGSCEDAKRCCLPLIQKRPLLWLPMASIRL